MTITHQQNVVRPNGKTILSHLALNKEIQDYLTEHRLTQQVYYAHGGALFLYLHLNDDSCVIVKY